jgi:hypothetical protein
LLVQKQYSETIFHKEAPQIKGYNLKEGRAHICRWVRS